MEQKYSIDGWDLIVMPAVRDDVVECMTGVHRDAIGCVVTKLHKPPCPKNSKYTEVKNIGDILYVFWLEFKDFQHKTGPFDKEAIWLTNIALVGKYYGCHKLYSLPYKGVLGFIACRVCSKPFVIGPCDSSWDDVNNIKTGKRSLLGGESTKKRSVFNTTANIHDARINRNIMENIDAEVPN